ncbi:MBOAT family O-acyltransferase [Zobellia barbeyronii]|uniref:MBOAT family protein n=1 Tax=Zobellia barbeyronii TaxID=2748009 RepID=A0ABS5WJS0_9FLAO|nr:MBOAT family O-acyltransferase [Zobellia barbeyronii]MBT2163196.1 MBOAT family protein [Zobellia barbeyronii]
MLFNSNDYLIFLPIVYVLYWLLFKGNLKAQNLVILVSSYVFYGWWDYRFLFLILLSTLVDFFIGLKVQNELKPSKQKIYLWVSILFNIGVLAVFKYFNFFIDSLMEFLMELGFSQTNRWTINIILPVGISFYTFQTMSYTIDIYRKNLKATSDFIGFASFVAFFPQLVAGPIERATNLLPQILNKRKFDYKQSVQGLRLILYGMFKKVVIADSLAPRANDIFANYQDYDGGTLWLGAIYFSFQIYCDFSGYSDIAIGTSKLFGFELMSNFKFPYFSRNIGEFWRRWHISLSTWFRDYLYIPLGGSKGGKWQSLKNIFIIFLVSGFWHGANWTFLMWGFIHALLYVPLFYFDLNRKYVGGIVAQNKFLPSIKEFIEIGVTYFFVVIAWVFFRSDTISNAFLYIKKMFIEIQLPSSKLQGVGYCLVFIIIEWFLRKDERLSTISKYKIIRILFYIFLLFHVVQYFGVVQTDFIYFQF